MSRIGKKPVSTKDTQVSIDGRKLTVKGKLGELNFNIPADVLFKHDNDELIFEPANNTRQARALWGTTRAIAQNIVTGVTNGYSITMEAIGVGYRAQVQGQVLKLSLGYSHDINYAFPKEVQIKCLKPTIIEISGFDKQLVGQVARDLRDMRPPEPYKGKGVRKQGEYIRRKEGKKK